MSYIFNQKEKEEKEKTLTVKSGNQDTTTQLKLTVRNLFFTLINQFESKEKVNSSKTAQ